MYRVTTGLLAAVLLAATGCASDAGDDASPTTPQIVTTLTPATTTAPAPTTQPTPTSTTTVPPATTVPESSLPPVEAPGDIDGALQIEARPFPDWVTVTDEFAWVANVDTGVGRYDLDTGELLGSSAVGTGPVVCSAMDAYDGSLWVVDCDTTTLIRIDLATGEPQAVIALPVDGLASEASVAAGPGGVFVMSNDTPAEVAHVDPSTNEVVGTFGAPDRSVAVRQTAGSLWFTNDFDGQIRRVDPATGELQADIDVPEGVGFLAVDGDNVWAMSNQHGLVVHVDAATNEVVAVITVSDTRINGGDIAVGGGSVWARVSDALVARIDPATHEVVQRIGPGAGSGSVAADANAVWISDHDVITVWRIPVTPL
jgi:virginiamycin B lyase